MPLLRRHARLQALSVLIVAASSIAARGEVGIVSERENGPFRHVRALQDIASANGGNRAAGTPGYDASATYVAERLSEGGYAVRLEPFTFTTFEERSPPVLASGDGSAYVTPPEAMRTLRNSGSADVTARLQGVDLGVDKVPLGPSTSGCEPEDFATLAPGAIALVRRGTCPFQRKVELAAAAKAAGVIVMNQGTDGQTDRFSGQLASPAPIPVLGVSTEVGRRLAAIAEATPDATLRLKVDAETAQRSTHNVIAQRGPLDGTFTVVGAHLDSVPEGPGMNDNASGSAAILEAALRLARATEPGPPVRFAFWGAEERGLVGSRHHLDALPEDERRRIDLYVNLDMVGSPNFGRFVQLTKEGRSGSVGRAFEAVSRSFADHGLPVEERSGRGRGYGSDDATFAAKGIPTIGLFTGAGGAKSEAHARLFGGKAAQPFDPCYHKACDTSGNIDVPVLNEMTDALSAALNRLAAP